MKITAFLPRSVAVLWSLQTVKVSAHDSAARSTSNSTIWKVPPKHARSTRLSTNGTARWPLSRPEASCSTNSKAATYHSTGKASKLIDTYRWRCLCKIYVLHVVFLNEASYSRTFNAAIQQALRLSSFLFNTWINQTAVLINDRLLQQNVAQLKLLAMDC